MRIAVHKNKESLFDRKWIDFLNAYGCEVMYIDLKKSGVIDEIRDCDGVMWHFLHSPRDKRVASAILDAIEQQTGMFVWPNYQTRWHFDEKIDQHYLFEIAGIPSVKSWVFWDKQEAYEFVAKTSYPLVFKLSVGAGAANVVKVENCKQAISIIDDMFTYGVFPYQMNEFKKKRTIMQILRHISQYAIKNRILTPQQYELQKGYVYFQEFIRDNNYDIRITIIGNRAFGFVRYNRNNDFRASGSGLIDYSIDKIPTMAIKIAFSISTKYKFQSMAYDFLMKEPNQPVINEISYGYVDEAVYNCPGHWDQNLVWHEGHMWPEEAHVQDFVNLIRESRNEKILQME